MRYLPSVHWLRRARAFSVKPYPRHYSVNELGFIWLFIATLNTEHNMGWPIVKEEDFGVLSHFLFHNYDSLSKSLKASINPDMLEFETGWGVDWGRGIAGIVDSYAYLYVQILENRGMANVGKTTQWPNSKLAACLSQLHGSSC